MDGDQPSPPRRRGRPRRDAFIGPMNRPARWADPNLPRRATRAHREVLQEQANGTIPHIEIGEDGRPRLLNGDQLRAENLQQLAHGEDPFTDLEDGNEQAAPQSNGAQPVEQQQQPPEPQQDPEEEEDNQEQEPEPEPHPQTPPPQPAHFSPSSSPPVNFNPFGPPKPPQQLNLPNLLPQTPLPPPQPQPQPQGQGPPAPVPASSSSSGIFSHIPPQFPPFLIDVQIPNPPSTDSAIADVNTPTPEQILAELQQPQVVFDLSDFQHQGEENDDDEEEEEEDVQADEENVTPEPELPQSSAPLPPQQPESPPPPAQLHQEDLVPAGWQPGMWSGGWAGNDQQRVPGAVPFAGSGDENNGENDQEAVEWQQREEAIEWLRGNDEGGEEQGPNEGPNEGQQPNEGEEDRQPPNDDENEDEAARFGQEPSETSSSSSSSYSSSDDDHDPGRLGRGYEDDEDDRDDTPEQDGRRRHPYEPIEGEIYFNDSQESLDGPLGPDEEEEEGQDQGQQSQEPRSSGSLPDFDEEQWEEEERALSRRNNRTSPLRWWERGGTAPRHPGGDLAIMPQRLANHDSVEHNALRWTSRPSVDFGEFSRPPVLLVDWSSEEDWDEYNENEEDEESSASSCTGSSSSSNNGSGGSSDSDDELPPVAMPVNGTRPASSSGSLSSSVGRGRGSSPPIHETPPSSPSRCPPSDSSSSAIIRPLSFPSKGKIHHKGKKKNNCPPDSSSAIVRPSFPYINKKKIGKGKKKKKKKKKKKTVPYPLDLVAYHHLSKTFELDMAERTARSGAPPPSAGISKATDDKTAKPDQQQQQPPSTKTPATPPPPTRKPSLRRNSAGPFQHSEYPSTTLFRSDFTFLPRSGRLSEPPTSSVVSGDDNVHAMPDYIGQGDQDISPKTKNPPKVPQTGHVLPGTREARPQVGGKGFPQVHKDGGVKVYDAGEAYHSSEEEDGSEEEKEAMTRQTAKRRRSVVYDCPPFSAESHLLRQVRERERELQEQQQEEEEEEEEKKERVGTYYQYNPRYDNEMGYTGGLTGSAVPAWIRTATTQQQQQSDMSGPQTLSWVSAVSSTATESSNATTSKSSTWSAKRSISSISDYDDSEDDRVIGSSTPAKKRRLSPEPVAVGSVSSKRPRTSVDGDGVEGDVRSSKRPRPEASTPVHRQGLSAKFVGIASQQTDAIEEEARYDPAMTAENEEYDPKTVGLPRTQGSPGSTQKSCRQGSTEYDPAKERQEEEYDPQHP